MRLLSTILSLIHSHNLSQFVYSKLVRQQIVRQFTDHAEHIRELTQALTVMSELLILAGEVQRAEKLQSIASKHAMVL